MTDFMGSWERQTGKIVDKQESFNAKFPFKQINIMFIPIGCMRPQYPDGFDYWMDEHSVLQVRIADFENPDFAMYWAIHELIEAWRCARDGISLTNIEKFDTENKDHDDPGSLKDAPYHKQHMQSMTIQHLICEQDGYSYDEYMGVGPYRPIKGD